MPAKVQFKEGIATLNCGVWSGPRKMWEFVKWLNLAAGQDATEVLTSERMDIEIAEIVAANMGAKILESSEIVTEEIM